MLTTAAVASPARRLEPADLAWATTLLAAACTHHPVLHYCCPGGPAALPRRRWLLQQLLGFGLRFGRVYANTEGTALAVWLGPGSAGAVWRQVLRTGLLAAALVRLGWGSTQRVRRFVAASNWVRRHGTAAALPHYLLALAVHPAHRGQGHGQRLLQATLAVAQPALAASCVSLQEPRQLPFYQRQGFRLLGQCPAGLGPDGPACWGLVRHGVPG